MLRVSLHIELKLKTIVSGIIKLLNNTRGLFMKKRFYVVFLITLLLGIMLIMSGCSETKAKTGDTVKVDYTLKLSDGTVYQSTEELEPFEFTIGGNQVIPSFENAVIGLKVGESITITILAADAYGEYHQELVFVVDRTQLPADPEPRVGLTINGTNQAGTITYTIIAVDETTVTVDGNHELAGKDLTFEITLVEIVKE
jgi:peptidylprolyl isomerase